MNTGNSYFKFFIVGLAAQILIGCTSGSGSNATPTGNKTYISSEENGIQECSINTNGDLSDCKKNTNEFLTDPDGMALYFDIKNKRPYMFISNYKDNTIVSCELNQDGSIGACNDSQAKNLHHPEELEVLNIDGVNFLLIGNETSGGVTRCTINDGAILSDCTNLIPNISSNTALVTYAKRDIKTETNHTYIYVNTISDEQNKQLLRCNIESNGDVHNCQYQAVAYFEKNKPGTIDAMSIYSDYIYMTFKDKNKILVCPINDEASIINCNERDQDLIGPYEITFSNSGLSDNGLPQVKAYITSLTNHVIYTCNIDNITRLPIDCVVTEDINAKAPRNIITSTEIGNIDNVVEQLTLQEGNVQKADLFDNLSIALRTYNRIVFSPLCGGYLEVVNDTSSPVKIEFVDSNITIKPYQAEVYYYAINTSTSSKDGFITYSDGTRERFIYTINKNLHNCTTIVKASGANSVAVPYDAWISGTPNNRITVSNHKPLAKHRSNFIAAADGSLLAYASVFNGARSDLENQALVDLKHLGYGDFMEVTSLDILKNQYSGIASISSDNNTIMVYQDEKSNGIKLLDDNGMPTDISYDQFVNKSSFINEDSDHIDGKILLAYNKNNDTILIAYRGTANEKNAKVDISVEEIAWSINTPDIDPIMNQLLQSARVHKGFSQYKTILFNNAIVNNWISSHRNVNTNYLVTGHSLGGAAASLLSAQLLSDGIWADKLSVITFGQPAVGTKDFANAYTMKRGFDYRNYTRVANEYDPVVGSTSIVLFDYVHYGVHIGLPGITFGSLNTHSMDGYYSAATYYGALQ